MLKIFKYSVELDDEFDIELPVNAKVLCVQTQHDLPKMWVLSDQDEINSERRSFVVLLTGSAIHRPIESLVYIGSFQLISGHFIGHLFEVID